MVNMDLPVTVITVISNLFIGALTYFKNPKGTTNKLFGVLSSILVAWAITNYFSLHAPTLTDTLHWIRIILAIVTPMWTILFLLVLTFPNEKLKMRTPLLIALIIYTLITSVVALSPYMFIGITGTLKTPQPIPGPGIVLHAALAIGCLIASMIVLIKKFVKSSGRERVQLKFFLFGIISSFSLLIFTNFIMVNVLKITSFVVFGPFFTLILVASISYAIIRHRFLDIGLIVTRAIAYSLLVTIISIFYVSATFIVSSVFLGTITVKSQLLIYTILTIIVALSFQRLRELIENFSDKILFKGRYDSNKLLSRLGTIMSTNIELEPLTDQVIHTLLEQMRVSKGAFVILGEGLASIYSVIGDGFPKKIITSYNQISVFLPFPNIIVFDELEENHLKNLMREMNVSIIKILRVEGQPVGLLLLGEKASGEIYSPQDLKLIDILAPEIAIAIQNSQSYDKIKKFNLILTEEVKRATSDLQTANKKLKELDILKDEFVSVASHELRTPMTAIRSYVWMALHKSDITLSQKLERYLYRTLVSTERLINLVNDMLNVSRIESGHIEITPRPFDILALVRDVMEEVQSKADEKKLQLLVLEHKMPQVFADPDKIHEVLLNLIGNSLKFTYPGGSISVDFFTDSKMVEVSIRDNGSGIAKEDLAKLFKKFGRLDNSYVSISTSGGTGLGLYISKSLVEMMHGSIWASSDGVDKGSTFSFSLPIATEEILKESEKYHIRAKGEVKTLEPVAI